MMREQIKKQSKPRKKNPTLMKKKSEAKDKKKKGGGDSTLRKPSDAKKKKALGTPVPSLEASLAVEAHRLRATLREISNRFVTEIETDIVRSIEMISEVHDGARKKKELKKMIALLQGLELKPNKGRLCDLKNIRNLIQEISAQLEAMI